MTTKPITLDRIEKALDYLAGAIVRHGAEGEKLLPIYERLEREADERRKVDEKLATVRARFQRSRDLLITLK